MTPGELPTEEMLKLPKLAPNVYTGNTSEEYETMIIHSGQEITAETKSQ